MTRKVFPSISVSLTVFTSLIFFHTIALAGPPLICWPFDIGTGKSLPWGGNGWHALDPNYHIDHLVADTISLLSGDVPVLVRMETLRRATIYAMENPKSAAELHARLLARADAAKEMGQFGALALFDLGYLEETYKQAKSLNFGQDLDGYSKILRAIRLRGGDPEMEFAAALISEWPRREDHAQHLQEAVLGASGDPLLTQNLMSHFQNRGRTLEELRANVGTAKNQ